MPRYYHVFRTREPEEQTAHRQEEALILEKGHEEDYFHNLNSHISILI